jgi:hypothetical protein
MHMGWQVVPLPVCMIGYVPRETEDPLSEADSVLIPVYEGLDRSKLLTKLRMPCKSKQQARWIMAGTAIFVSAD